MIKCVIELCDQYDEKHPDDAKHMLRCALRAQSVRSEIKFVNRLIAVNKQFDEKHEKIDDEHRELNVRWTSKWKAIRSKWIKDKRQEASRRRLYGDTQTGSNFSLSSR